MGCNCGKNKKQQGYTVNKPDGTKQKANSLTQAMQLARQHPGSTYQRA